MKTATSKIKYILITSLGLLMINSGSLYAAASPTATKANELKMRSCQVREKAIDNRMDFLVKMATNMFEVFGNITGRVTDFYQDKVVAEGKSVENYDELLQAVEDKKTLAQEALDKAKTDSDAFTCETGDPKTALTDFRKNMQSVKASLHEYRTSVKNLLVAVRTVNKTLEGTPKPTKAVDQQ